MKSRPSPIRPTVNSSARRLTLGLFLSVALFVGMAVILAFYMLNQVSNRLRDQQVEVLKTRLDLAVEALPTDLGTVKTMNQVSDQDIRSFKERLAADGTRETVIMDIHGQVQGSDTKIDLLPYQKDILAAVAGGSAWNKDKSGQPLVFEPIHRNQAVIGLVAFSLDWKRQQQLLNVISLWIWFGTLISCLFVSLGIWLVYRLLTREARRRNRALSTILEQAPIGIYTLEPTGVIDTFNPKMVELSGAAAADKVIGLNVFEMPSYRQANLIEDIRQAISGHPFDKDVEYVSFTAGRRTWRHYRGVPLFMPDGVTLDRLLLLVEDITMQKELEQKNVEHARQLEKYAWEQSQQLALKNEQLHTVIDQLPVVFWAVDPRGSFTICEGSGLGTLGLKEDEALGHSIFEIFHASREFTDQVNQALAGETFSAQAAIGERVYDHNYSSLRDEQGEIIGATGVSVDVTDRARTEQRFRAMVNNSADVMSIIDRDGAITFGTEATTKVFGFSLPAFLNQPFTSFVHPDDLADVAAKMAECVAVPGRTMSATFRLRHLDGHYVDVESIGQNFLDDPSIHGIVVNTRDMTERVRYERKISHNVAIQGAMASLSAKFVTIEDFRVAVREVLREIGQVSRADGAFFAMLDRDRSLTDYERWVRPGLEKDMPSFAMTQSWFQGSQGFPTISEPICLLDDQAIDAYGREITSFCHQYNLHGLIVNPIKSGEEMIGLIGVLNSQVNDAFGDCEQQVLRVAAEVTAAALQRRTAFNESHKQTERQAAIASLGQAIMLENRQSTIIEAGAQAVKSILAADATAILEYRAPTEDFTVREIVGEPSDEVVGKIIQGNVHSQAGFAVLTRETVIVEDYLKESRFTAVSMGVAGPVRSGAAVIIGDRHQPWGVLNVFSTKVRALSPSDIGFLESVAHLIGISLSRAASEYKSRDLDHLKSKFIQVVSHQFRTPLSAVRWNLESLLSGDIGTLTPETREFIRITYEANNEVINRIRDLLTVLDIEERRITLNPELISFDSIVASVAADFTKRAALKRINLKYIPPAEPGPAVLLDQDRVRVTLEKLLDNALAYTPAGGDVTIATQRLDGRLRVTITDSGIGIPVQEQNRLFERFYRASNANTMRPDASGLGLTIAKYFVEQQDGTLGFTSKEGSGSTFWFELPIK